jgi:hypothetical protein
VSGWDLIDECRLLIADFGFLMEEAEKPPVGERELGALPVGR